MAMTAGFAGGPALGGAVSWGGRGLSTSPSGLGLWGVACPGSSDSGASAGWPGPGRVSSGCPRVAFGAGGGAAPSRAPGAGAGAEFS
ncbi:MAG: hypothetical protein DPW14_05495 [Planctomycetes bacterium]|nr:hypothetical protein [Planctomycetota bacterium]